MLVPPPGWRRRASRLLRGLAAPALLSLGGAAAAQPGAPVVAVAAPAPVVLPDLRTARQVALERQPAVAAARASYAAAVAGNASLERLKLAGLFARDLPIRRQQSATGLQASAAAVRQAEADAAYAVTYTWLAVHYAREQGQTARDALARIDRFRSALKPIIDERKRRDVRKEHLELVEGALASTRGRVEEARIGEERALAALREALGLGPDCVVVVPPRRLPLPAAAFDRDEVVRLALCHRGEVAQADAGRVVTLLEIEAQRATFMPTARTFASGSDLHAVGVPQADRGLNYRPGGVALEMPVSLSGHRSGRVDQASALAGRADAVAAKTRGLVALEAEEALLRVREQLALYRGQGAAYERARKYSDDLELKFNEPIGTYPSVEDLLGVGSTVARFQTEAREAHFRYLAALSVLERATGGAVCVDFDVPAPADGDGPGNGNGDGR